LAVQKPGFSTVQREQMIVYGLLADVVVVVHFALVAFVVLGLPATVIGLVAGWSWARNFWFRATHVAVMLVIAAQAICGVLCPLTILENMLRERAGDATYPGSFIGYWAHELLFVQADRAVLTVCYVSFFLMVLEALVLGPPRWPQWRRAAAAPRANETARPISASQSSPS
jgi:hypothetical protein